MEQVFGAVVGKYEIVRPIGEGGMAQIYLCVRRGAGGFEKRVVMKVLHSKFLGDPEYVSMFLEEARLLSRLQHPNIVSVFEVECVEGIPFRIPYLAMEFVNGPTLGRLHKRSVRMGMHDIGLMLHIIYQVCQGLHYAHTIRINGLPAGLVHRDVSSQNILIDGETGAVKIIDFGIAKSDEGQAKTEVGVLKGKIQYMAPEVLRGARPDARADLYSVGVLLYRLVTDRAPVIDGENVWSARLSGRYPRVSELVPGVSPTLEAIIDRALHPEPTQRYQSAAELGNDLHREIERLAPDLTRLPSWIQAVFPNGEAEWSKRMDAGTTAAGTMHSTLNQLVTDGGTRKSVSTQDTPTPIPVPASGPSWWVKAALAAGVVVGTWAVLWAGLTARAPAPTPAPGPQPVAQVVPEPVVVPPPPAPAVAAEPVPEPAPAPTFDLRSEPRGAEVWAGNVKLGTTPFVLDELPAPAARLRLRLQGYEEQVADLNTLGRTGELNVRLAKVRPAKPPRDPSPEPSSTPPAGSNRPGVATER